MSISNNIRHRMQANSWIRKMFEEGKHLIKQYGKDNVFDFSLGNPILEPPPEFNKELSKLINQNVPGIHRYMENAGFPETRQVIASHLSSDAGIDISLNSIIMTVGAAGALNVALKAMLNPGDEVIIFSPFFAEFENYIDNHGGKVRIVPTDKSFLPKIDELEKAVSSKTRAVIINSPNNPTGVIYDEKSLINLCNLLENKQKSLKNDIYIISDETYRRVVYDSVRCPYIFNHYENSIAVTSHSKDLGLPGERIGYIAVNPKIHDHDTMVAALIFCNRILGFVNAPALMQQVIKYLQDVTVPVSEYKRKRDFLYSNLTQMGYEIVKPQGAFYLFPKCPIEDDVSFVNELQNQWHIMVVPGSGFGSPGYFRISYSVEDKVIEGSIPGFKKAAQKYGLSR